MEVAPDIVKGNLRFFYPKTFLLIGNKTEDLSSNYNYTYNYLTLLESKQSGASKAEHRLFPSGWEYSR